MSNSEHDSPGRNGALIVVEGVDGVGKTTLLPILAAKLEPFGTVRRLREPGGTSRAEEIRAIILDGKVRNGAETLELFSLARESLVKEVIDPALERGEIILQDRYTLSTRVYQGEQGVDDKVILARTERAIGKTTPDATIVLVISEEELVRRRAARARAGKTQHDQFDQGGIDKLLQRQRLYVKLAQDDPSAIMVDAEGTVQEISDRIIRMLQRQGVLDRLGQKRIVCSNEQGNAQVERVRSGPTGR